MNYVEEKLKPHTHSLLAVFESEQTYLNLLYLLLSFPLGLLYFNFLVVGLLSSISSTFILGIPVLIGVVYAWQYIAQFERSIAISWLHVKIRPLLLPFPSGSTFSERFRLRLTNPVMWKSLAFLLAKFPLGIFSFTIIASCVSLTLGLLSASVVLGLLAAPFLLPFGILTDRKMRYWLLVISLTGFGAGLISVLVINGLATLTGQFAKAMLGMSDKDLRLAQAKAIAEEERTKAVQAESSRRALIVNVSHELRTPIASIRGHVDSLLIETEAGDVNTPSRETLHNYLTIIQQEAERLGALVDDLLSLARSDAGELRLNIRPVNGSEVVEEVYQTMVLLARRERQVTLVHSMYETLPLIWADRQRLTQVLLNLVRNAIAYTPQGGIVSITLECFDSNR